MRSLKEDITRKIIKHQTPLKKFIERSIPDKFLAEDIYQETLMICIAKYDSLNNKELFLPWAKKISINLYIKNMKSDILCEQFDEMFHMNEKAIDQIDLIYKKQKFKILMSLMDLLSPNQKSIAIDYYLKGISRKDICQKNGLSTTVFDSRLQRAKEKLRKYIRRRHTQKSNQEFVNRFNELLKGEYTMDKFRIEISQSLLPDLVESEPNIIQSIKELREKMRIDFRVEIPTIHIIDNKDLKESEYIILHDEKRINEGQLSSGSKLSEMKSIISTVLIEQFTT